MHCSSPKTGMFTGATSHIQTNASIHPFYFNSSNTHQNVVVGSGHLIPIVGQGYTTLLPLYPPFTLNNVLNAL